MVIQDNGSYVIGIPTPLVVASSTTSFWIQENKALWISVYIIPPILFNLLNVRKFGEIEFWLSSIKVYTFVSLVILGLLLLMGASTAPQLLGTTLSPNVTDYPLIQCVHPSQDYCVSSPGFNCTTLVREFAY
jgi:amino acid permease